jgi:hypothetical protein
MKATRWGLLKVLTAGIVLFIVSCEKDVSEIGLNIQPGSDQINTFCDTIPVETFTLTEEHIVSDERSLSPLGSYLDPVFGFVKADFATQLILSSSNADFSGEVQTADSLVLFLNYSDYYGDTTTAHQLHVYELLTSIYKDSSYYSDLRFEASELSELASLSFSPTPSDSILAIHMPVSLMNRLLDSDASSFSSNANFIEFFKGIYVTTEDQLMDASIVYMDLLSSDSKMTLFYNDSSSFDFLINSDCARINMFDHNYSLGNSEFNSSLNDTINPNTLSYTQCLSGPKIKINIPELTNWNDSVRIAINMAQLIITISEDAQFAPPPRLSLVAINDNGLNEFLTDYKVNSSYFGGTLNETMHTYTFNIPLHIQELLIDTSLQSNGMYLVPMDNRINANRLIVYGGAHNEFPMQIKILYSKF